MMFSPVQKAFFNIVRDALERGDLRSAEHTLHQVKNSGIDLNAEMYHQMGVCYHRLGKLRGADAAFAQAFAKSRGTAFEIPVLQAWAALNTKRRRFHEARVQRAQIIRILSRAHRKTT